MTACGLLEPEFPSGSIQIMLETPSTQKSISFPNDIINAVQCTVYRNSEVVFNSYLTKANNQFRGRIEGLVPDTNYAVLLLGKKDMDSNLLLARGYASGIHVQIHEVTQVVMRWTSYTPVLNSPKEGEVLPDQKPNFSWESNPGAQYYQLKIANNDQFINPLIDQSNIWVENFNLSESLPNGHYHWKVRCVDTLGYGSSWSETWGFKIQFTGGLSAPELFTPQNNVIITETGDLEFQWQSLQGATVYWLQVGLDSLFWNPILNNRSLLTNQYTLVSPLPTEVLFWRVLAEDQHGNLGTWSSIWSFTVDPGLLIVPQLISPLDSSTIYDTTPDFYWQEIDGAVYRIVIDTNPNFASPVFDELNIMEAHFVPTNDLDFGTYYWKVRAFQSNGYWSEWSSTWQFTLKGILGFESPQLLSPVNGSTLFTYYPIFQWSSVPEATYYWLQVDNDIYFSSPEIDIMNMTETTYTCIDAINMGTHYWRVRCIDSVGEMSNWSDIWNFTIMWNE
jgi:hypothetical protein